MPDIRIIDTHAHILPCADHGSSSVSVSLELIETAKEIGVTAIAATPHFYSHKDNPDDFLVRREESYKNLRAALDSTEKFESFRIYKGAEITLEVDLLKNYGSRLKELCYENTEYILIEMPFVKWSDWVYEALYNIQAKYHLKPIIAHIERYPAESVETLLEYSPIAQINADFITSLKMKSYCKRLYNNGVVKFMGSDAHDNISRNYCNLGKVIKKLDNRVIEHMYENSVKMLNNEDFEF